MDRQAKFVKYEHIFAFLLPCMFIIYSQEAPSDDDVTHDCVKCANYNISEVFIVIMKPKLCKIKWLHICWSPLYLTLFHYIDVIMTTMASQITSLTVVYSTIYSDAYQRKHQSSASLAFVWGIHRDRWIPRTMCQLRGKCFHLMTSSCSE